MKLLIFFLFLMYGNICLGQNNIDDSKAIAILKEFYVAHQSIESAIKSIRADTYVWRLDSLQKKYCTSKLRSDAKKYRENGIDLLTNDNGINSESLKTMKIFKDVKNKNIYIVSYDILDNNYPKTPIKKHVVLHVGLISEHNDYKINTVR